MNLTQKITEAGKKYTSTVYRGTEYTLAASAFGWSVYTRRIGYGGRAHMGSVKVFSTLGELQTKCKAFAGIDLMAVL
jgi:hypothetical protein